MSRFSRKVSQIAASSAAGRAENARMGAEAARDSLNTTGKVFSAAEGTASGIAATSAGQQFAVMAADLQSYAIWRNNAGAALLLGSFSTSNALEFKKKTNSARLALGDSDGNLALRINGKLDILGDLTVDNMGGLETAGLSLSKNKTLRSRLALVDADGNMAFEINEKGQIVGDFSQAPIPCRFKTGGRYAYSVNHVFMYGQSLFVGQATPVLSTIQNYDNLMFARGMRPQYDFTAEAAAQWYAALIPAVEAQSPMDVSLAETPCMGAGDAIKQRIADEDGMRHADMQFQVMLSAPGRGAQTLAQLSKGAGTGHYERMIAQASYAMALANLAGKTYCVLAVGFCQGESDYLAGTTRAAYGSQLNTLTSDFNADFKAITGQISDIPLVMAQIASHKVGKSTIPTIALAQMDVETANPLAYIAAPMYHLEYQDTNNFHLNNISTRWIGAQIGLAIKRICIDQIDWKPLKPLSWLKQGNMVVVKFHVPSGYLAKDGAMAALIANGGFTLVKADGTALTLNSVTVLGADTVSFTAAEPVPAGALLRYGWSGDENVGSVSGPRGNLRDTQNIVLDPLGINKTTHNPCIIFEIGL